MMQHNAPRLFSLSRVLGKKILRQTNKNQYLKNSLLLVVLLPFIIFKVIFCSQFHDGNEEEVPRNN